MPPKRSNSKSGQQALAAMNASVDAGDDFLPFFPDDYEVATNDQDAEELFASESIDNDTEKPRKFRDESEMREADEGEIDMDISDSDEEYPPVYQGEEGLKRLKREKLIADFRRGHDPLEHEWEQVKIPKWSKWKTYPTLLPEMLHQEILDFVKYVEPAEGEHELRTLVMGRIRDVVDSLWQGAEVQVFGSFETRLYLPHSDIDLVIFTPDQRRHLTVPNLHKLAGALRKTDEYDKIDVIDRARVPILKCVNRAIGYPIDISFNLTSGVKTAAVVKKYVADFPALRPLVMVLKHFLHQRELNEVFSGGIGSYTLVTMMLNFLNMHPMLQMRMMDPSKNLGVLLIEFFELFGKNLNYEEVTVCWDGYKNKTDCGFLQGENRRHYLSVQDPLDKSNDLSRGAFGTNLIRSAFAHAFDTLTQTINYWQRQTIPSLSSSPQLDPSTTSHKRKRSEFESDIPPKRPKTILGYILRLNEELMEKRQSQLELFDTLLKEAEKIDNGEELKDELVIPPVLGGEISSKRSSVSSERSKNSDSSQSSKKRKRSKKRKTENDNNTQHGDNNGQNVNKKTVMEKETYEIGSSSDDDYSYTNISLNSNGSGTSIRQKEKSPEVFVMESSSDDGFDTNFNWNDKTSHKKQRTQYWTQKSGNKEASKKDEYDDDLGYNYLSNSSDV